MTRNYPTSDVSTSVLSSCSLLRSLSSPLLTRSRFEMSPHATPRQQNPRRRRTASDPGPGPFDTPRVRWSGDLSQPAVDEEDEANIRAFWDAMEVDKRENCHRYKPYWFQIDLRDGVCKRCRYKDRAQNKKADEPNFYTDVRNEAC